MFNSKYRYFDPLGYSHECFWRYHIGREIFEVSYKNRYGWIDSKIEGLEYFKKCDEISFLQAQEKYPAAFANFQLTNHN